MAATIKVELLEVGKWIFVLDPWRAVLGVMGCTYDENLDLIIVFAFSVGASTPPRSYVASALFAAYVLLRGTARAGLGVVTEEPLGSPIVPTCIYGREKTLQGHMILSSSKRWCKTYHEFVCQPI